MGTYYCGVYLHSLASVQATDWNYLADFIMWSLDIRQRLLSGERNCAMNNEGQESNDGEPWPHTIIAHGREYKRKKDSK